MQIFGDCNFLLDVYRLPKQTEREFIEDLESAGPGAITNTNAEMEFKKIDRRGPAKAAIGHSPATQHRTDNSDHADHDDL